MKTLNLHSCNSNSSYNIESYLEVAKKIDIGIW